MAKKVLLILAEGFEEIEAITVLDVLRRAELEVVVAGLPSKSVTGAHGLRVDADECFEDYDDLPDAIVLPGGMPGSKNLAQSEKVRKLLKKMNQAKKIIGAICAAPALALAPAGLLDGKTATCYPGFENNFSKAVTFSEDHVVVDGHVITSRGPGSALDFALQLTQHLAGKEKADTLRQGLLAQAPV